MTLEGFNFHQMVLNLKCNGMVSNIKYQYGIWTICIRIYTSETLFGYYDKKTKILGNCDEIHPRVEAKWASQIMYEPPKFVRRVWGLI